MSVKTVDLDWRPSARQKFLNCIGDFIGVVPDHRCVVYPRQLDIACARNILGEKSAALYIDGLVIGSVNYEGGHPDRRDNIADVAIWLFMRMSAVAEAGLAPSRSNRPNQRTKAGSFAREEAKKAARPPAPHD